MMTAWPKLSARERLLLFGGGAVLLASGLYAFTYQPLIDAQQRLETSMAAQRQIGDQLRRIAAEAAALQSAAPDAVAVDSGQSLISVIDASSLAMNIKPAIKRLTPEGPNKVTLWLERCEFDRLIAWLAQLDRQQRITVEQLALSREPGAAGQVAGKVTLGRSAS